jgi:hypothetical protein
MLEPQFDPYEALITLDRNVRAVIEAHNLLAQRVEQHQETIDILIKGLNAANAANLKLMEQGFKDIYTNINTQGQH